MLFSLGRSVTLNLGLKVIKTSLFFSTNQAFWVTIHNIGAIRIYFNFLKAQMHTFVSRSATYLPKFLSTLHFIYLFIYIFIFTQQNFHYDSSLWQNNKTFNLAGRKTGFDTQETKLSTYWNTPFSKICLGMKIDQQIKFVVINQTANSLYILIADGQYRAILLGRNT